MLVSIDEGNRLPIYLQIARQVKEQILVGEIGVGEELPSVRELGNSLGISLHTARSAYQVLSEAGLIRVRLGKKARAMMPTAGIGHSPSSEEFISRMRELIVEGLLRGSNAEELHQMLDTEIAALMERGANFGIRPSEGGET